MFPKDENVIRQMLEGNSLDFYLEDDMFEIEGLARIDDGKIFIDVIDAVGHVLAISGNELEVFMSGSTLKAKRTDNGKDFFMEINRIYKKLINPEWKDFMNLKKKGISDLFFKKETDTLIWYDVDENRWFIEKNKINMYFSGDRTPYESLDTLFAENANIIKGVWQAVSYSSEVEYEEKYYDEYSDRVRLQEI